MADLPSSLEIARRRLGGLPYVGSEPSVALLTEADLGELAALAWHPRQDAADPWVAELCALLRGRFLRFETASAVAALEALAAHGVEAAASGWVVAAAAQVIEGCVDPKAPEIRAALDGLLGGRLPAEPGELLVALYSCSGRRLPQHPDPFVASERGFVETLAHPADRVLFGRICATWAFAVEDADLTPRGADPLALLPGYLAFAERVTQAALRHVRGIHDGSTPYAPDRAFSVEAAQVLRRALLAGLDQGAAWAERDVVPLLRGVSVAPDPAHKTVPSQSASIAVMKAIAERPAPALVDQLRSSLRAVRHTGLKKILARLLTTAERRLVYRAELLSELDPALELPKGLSRVVVRAFEALLLDPAPQPYAGWFSRICEHAGTSKVAARLVWRFTDGQSALPVFVAGRWSFIDARGEPCQPALEGVRLWHPLQPNADADAWRRLVVARRLEQPFNQVFRETYSAASLSRFSVPALDLHSLLGLSRARGWVLRRGGRLARKLGQYRVELDVGEAFPGAVGITRCYGVGFFRGAERDAVEPSRLDAQGLSECLREVDLLVSVAASAVDPALADDNASVRSRRAALVRMLGETPDPSQPYVAGRYVRSGDLAIHIATGRVSERGAEREFSIESAKRRVLPYPDKILERIVTVLDRQRRGQLEPGRGG